jgi:hypothetical protein
MSYQERRAFASLISTILVSVFYFAYVLQRYPAANPYSADVFRFWGSAILVFIPVSIAANIAIQIVFTMAHTMATNEKERSFTDERDKLIELRAARNSFYAFMVGFLLAMGSLVMGMPPSVMFIVLIVSGAVTGMVGGISELYFYRRGF